LFVGIALVLLIPKYEIKTLKMVTLFIFSVVFSLLNIMWVFFNNSLIKFQYNLDFCWLAKSNLAVSFGVDGISLFFILLTTLLFLICTLFSWSSVNIFVKEYLLCFLVMEFFLVVVFSILDLLFFYIFFESILIPMFVIIGVWGSRERKIRAAYLFFFYTLVGSVLMLAGILYIYSQTGTTDYETLLLFNFSNFEQKILWFSFFMSFAAKVPMLPFHIWLPEAHVEAPTTGSVFLAGILLKLGSYGFIRFSIPFFPNASLFFVPLVHTMSVVAIVYTSLTAIRQTDLKRVVAYTSVAHMNLVMLGLFSFNSIGLEGAILQSLSHGFVSSALFLIIGVVYDRHHTRMIKYYGGLTKVMPLFSGIFLVFTMANIGLPMTSSFVGEFLLMTGCFKINTASTFFGSTGMIIGGGYALWLLNRIIYGNLKTQYLYKFFDLNKREFFSFAPLIFYTLFMGVYPKLFLSTIHFSVSFLYF
jgi:proton-translocating NADH-quinone oxidoreductase chain M